MKYAGKKFSFKESVEELSWIKNGLIKKKNYQLSKNFKTLNSIFNEATILNEIIYS